MRGRQNLANDERLDNGKTGTLRNQRTTATLDLPRANLRLAQPRDSEPRSRPRGPEHARGYSRRFGFSNAGNPTTVRNPWVARARAFTNVVRPSERARRNRVNGRSH